MSVLRSSRLIAGSVPRVELSEREARVAEILDALRAPIHGETDGDEEAIAAIVAAVSNGRAPSVVIVPRRTARGRSTLKIAAVAVVILLAATSAAAAAGSLPRPLQRAVARLLSHVGVSVPKPHDPPRPDETDGDESGPVPLPVTNPSRHGRETGPPPTATAGGSSDPLGALPGSDPTAAPPATSKVNPTTTTTKPQGAENAGSHSSGANLNGVDHSTAPKAVKTHGPTK